MTESGPDGLLAGRTPVDIPLAPQAAGLVFGDRLPMAAAYVPSLFICLVRELRALEGVEDGLLIGGDCRWEGVFRAVDRDGR